MNKVNFIAVTTGNETSRKGVNTEVLISRTSGDTHVYACVHNPYPETHGISMSSRRRIERIMAHHERVKIMDVFLTPAGSRFSFDVEF